MEVSANHKLPILPNLTNAAKRLFVAFCAGYSRFGQKGGSRRHSRRNFAFAVQIMTHSGREWNFSPGFADFMSQRRRNDRYDAVYGPFFAKGFIPP